VIFPLLLGLATVNFFGTDDFVDLSDDEREKREDERLRQAKRPGRSGFHSPTKKT